MKEKIELIKSSDTEKTIKSESEREREKWESERESEREKELQMYNHGNWRVIDIER